MDHSCSEALEEVLGLDPRTPQARNRVARGDTETTNTYFAAYYDTLSIAFRSLPASSCSSATPTDGVRFEVSTYLQSTHHSQLG
eukprot:2983974-Amphidinium_carterae.2